MILDKTRQRTLPRRAFMLGVALTAAALVPLAMLRPVASAQTSPAVAGAVQLVGLANASALSGQAWDQAGNVLPTAAFLTPFPKRSNENFRAPRPESLSGCFSHPRAGPCKVRALL